MNIMHRKAAPIHQLLAVCIFLHARYTHAGRPLPILVEEKNSWFNQDGTTQNAYDIAHSIKENFSFPQQELLIQWVIEDGRIMSKARDIIVCEVALRLHRENAIEKAQNILTLWQNNAQYPHSIYLEVESHNTYASLIEYLTYYPPPESSSDDESEGNDDDLVPSLRPIYDVNESWGNASSWYNQNSWPFDEALLSPVDDSDSDGFESDESFI